MAAVSPWRGISTGSSLLRPFRPAAGQRKVPGASGGAVWRLEASCGLAVAATLRRAESRRSRRLSQRATAVEEVSTTATEESGSSWKYDLIRSVGEECQTEAELRKLVEKKPDFVCYDGFEPSGRMHIAQGVYKSVCVNKCTKAGGQFIFWVADWFALMNDKMGGDIEKIRTVGKYLIEVWKVIGMDMSKVKFLWSSDEISRRAEEYWGQALDIGSRTTLARVKKCCQIMGRGEDSLTAAQILYPLMQCTDIFFLKADICQLGVDQRKVNMLARDYCDAAGRKLKPVILSHHMLYGLKKGQAKMSKSDPDSAIFMEDAAEDVTRKILNAYCPSAPEDQEATSQEGMSLVEDALKNPCLDYIQYTLFSREDFRFQVGEQVYESFQDLKDDFVQGKLEEALLKESLANEVNSLLEPVRRHFEEDAEAKELLEKVSAWRRGEDIVIKSFPTHLGLDLGAEALAVVFAPLPSELLRLSDVFQVLESLRSAEGKRVLWLQDWSAKAVGAAGGSVDCVKGFYQLLLHGLNALDPELMSEVTVQWQGEAILSGPSDYWTSVINAGRQCSLEAIRGALAADEELEIAGQVVATIMHLGDVLALVGGREVVLYATSRQRNMHDLAAKHAEACGFAAPEIQVVDATSLRLQADGEGLEVDTQILLTDSEMDINRKFKKAFCEPGNVDFCPPVNWVQALLTNFQLKDFVVSRKEQNGGDLRYDDLQKLREDFGAEVLHPGDLKPSLAKTMNSAMAKLREGLKSKDLKTAQKKLANYAKSLKKKQK
ncbi:unnamed protein product [Durusdinium trenchii]|uniref:tyrosine--tRNA ligase n=2 Tax=Durusdinium trenchii TaxID=1381693 RepID=A0ABP0QUX8_9DINO